MIYLETIRRYDILVFKLVLRVLIKGSLGISRHFNTKKLWDSYGNDEQNSFGKLSKKIYFILFREVTDHILKVRRKISRADFFKLRN